MDTLPLRPTAIDIHGLLLSDHSSTRAQFSAHFEAEVRALAEAISEAFLAWRDLDRIARTSQRTATVSAFIFAAVNAIVSASQLLLCGMLIPAGNLMRQYGEATAMACLCSTPLLDTFDRFTRHPDTFPVNDSLGLMSRKNAREALNIDETEWQAFVTLTKFTDKLSHPGLFSIAAQVFFAAPDHLIVGGEFDADKVDEYRAELTRRRTAATVLAYVARQLTPPVTPSTA